MSALLCQASHITYKDRYQDNDCLQALPLLNLPLIHIRWNQILVKTGLIIHSYLPFYSKCSLISSTFLNKMFVIRAGIHKRFTELANTGDSSSHTASEEAV